MVKTDTGQKPADAEVREQALDPARSFIVQAPAGSGKTELLTRRVLRLLARVDDPEQILAITFTRKAASEMRNRVIEALQAAQSGAVPDSPYMAEGQAMASNVLARDVEHDWQLLRNPQRLNIRTIDSLCAQLACRLPVVSLLGAPAAVREDAQPLYRQAAARLLDTQLFSLDVVLLQLGNRMDRAQQLLAELLSKRDQWSRYISYSDDPATLRAPLERMLGQLVKSGLWICDAACRNCLMMNSLHWCVSQCKCALPCRPQDRSKKPPGSQSCWNCRHCRELLWAM